MPCSLVNPRRPARRQLGDEQLMRLVAGEADPLAFALLYHRHVQAATALAVQVCSRPAVAEEVVQEAFLSMWRGRRHYDSSRGGVRAWLLWIVRNRAIDVLRQGGSLADGDVSEPLVAPERTDQQAGRRERTREVLAALGELPIEQSAVIALAYYGGYTHAEIAALMGAPLGTVKGRMRLGLRRMADGLLASA